MTTKLTLSINKNIIEKAKKYAIKKKKSVSRIVEEYLKNISENDKEATFNKSIKSPITESILGMFKDNKMDYKKLLEEAILEKYK